MTTPPTSPHPTIEWRGVGMRWVIVNWQDTDDGYPLVWHNGDTDDFMGWGTLTNSSTWLEPDLSLDLPVDGSWVTQHAVAMRIRDLGAANRD